MNSLPAGLATNDNSRTEFFRDNNTVYAFYRGRKVHFTEVPDCLLRVFRKEMKYQPKLCMKIGITPDMDPLTALEKYLMHNYGELDVVLDIDTNNNTNREMSAQEAIEESNLSKREVEVLVEMAEGNSIPEVAEKLFISPLTAQTHSHHIKEKINARNLADMIRFAFRYRIAIL